jgi:hypothetical protein
MKQLKPERMAKPRVGWAGAPQHLNDLEFLREVIEATRKDVDWVFLGMCPDALKPLVSEHVGMRPFAEYPEALAGASLDLALAPLQDTPFNRCKSHLKVLEYGILGIPVIASALDPYLHCPVTLIEGTESDAWRSAIQAAVADGQGRVDQAEELQDWVRNGHMLHHRRQQWKSILAGKCDGG